MIVRCPQCATRYRLLPTQLAGRNRVRLRCTSCQLRFEPDLSQSRLDRATGAVDAVITGSVSAVPESTTAALPKFGGGGRPQVESGALPAIGGEVPRAAMPPRATGVLPARPTLVGGSVAAAGPGLPRFGSGEMQSLPAGPGPAPGSGSGALPAVGAGAALPRFGGAPAPAATAAPTASAAASPTGALPAFGGVAVARIAPAPASAAGLPSFGGGRPVTGALPALGQAVPRSATGALPTFGGARIAAPGQELPASLPPQPAVSANLAPPAAGSAPVAAAPPPVVEPAPHAAIGPDTEPDFVPDTIRHNAADELFGMSGMGAFLDPDAAVPAGPAVTGAREAPEPEGGGGVDPILAFQDVYREAGVRRADADIKRFIEATRDGETDGSALVEPMTGFDFGEQPFVPTRSTEPPLKAPAPAPVTEESALLDLALLASGLSEPAPAPSPPDPEALERERVIGLDVAGDAARRDALLASSRPNAWLATASAILAAVLLFAGFVAWKNDGLLDLRELDQMFAVALQGGTYTPRHVTVVRVRESAEGPVEEIADTDALSGLHALEIGDVTTNRYTTRTGVPVVVVAGAATNRTNEPLRGIEVRVGVFDADGNELQARTVPAGSEVHEAEIEQLDVLDLAALDAQVRDRATAITVEPGQQTRFAAVFELDAAQLDAPLRWDAAADSALRPCAEDCWARLRFGRTEAAAVPGEPPP